MKNLKRYLVIVAMVVFAGGAVYLNWDYNHSMGEADVAMVEAEDKNLAETGELEENGLLTETGELISKDVPVSDYFAAARLSRQQSRDEAMNLLETAAAGEGISQEVLDSAMDEIACMATWSMQEAQVENLLLAKGFAECVAFVSGDEISVAVPAPLEGLAEPAIAQITDAITTETDFDISKIRVVEIKAAKPSDNASTGVTMMPDGTDF